MAIFCLPSSSPASLRSFPNGNGGDVTLFGDGTAVATCRVDRTMPFIFSADDGVDVGSDTGLRVTDDEKLRQFNGKISWVLLDLGIDDHSPTTLGPSRSPAQIRQ